MNLRLLSLLSLLLFNCVAVFGQSFNMPYQGSDTTTLCNGTLYDHSGPSSNYSNGALGYFYLDIPGNTLSITFTSFQLEGCCDYVRIYDGIGTSGTLLLSANGYSLPNAGNPISVPSGKATIRFSSDGSVTYDGFALTWSGGGTTSPAAQFTLSNPNPPVNVPVSFTNTSLNGGSYVWDFGDGTTSTEEDPQHVYTSPGTYSVSVTAQNCHGSDVSSTQNVTVMNSPNFTLNPDSLYATVACGNSATTSFDINHSSGGTMVYDLMGREAGVPSYVFNEGFEGGLGNFNMSPSAYSGFNANAVIGGAQAGNTSVLLSGNTSSYNGLIGGFSSSQPSEFSYHIKPSNNYYHGEFVLGNNLGTGSNEVLYYSRVYYGDLRLYTSSGTYTLSMNANQWNHIEVKNIDWTNKTYDLYINGALAGTAYSFFTTSPAVNSVNELHIWNSNSYTCYFDEVTIGGQPSSPVSLSPQSGVLSSGNTNTINVSVSTTGKVAGRYWYEVKVKNNSTGPDSNITIPLVVDITGASSMNLDKSCINFGSIFSTMSSTDSVMIYNPGCDTLDVSSITSTSSDITTNASNLQVPPFDTTYLFISFSPSGVGSYTDTVSLITSNVDTAICINGSSQSAPVIATDSAQYNLTSVGCNDSIPFNFKIYNEGGANLTWDINAGPSLFDDFESGLNSSNWSSLGSNNIMMACQTYSGNYGLSMDGNNRIAETQYLQVQTGDSVKFWAYPGASGSGCENPDGGEDVQVQYSTNGASWFTLGTVYNYNYAGQFYSFAIPVSGQVKIRFYQSSHSGTGFDNYIIDDFSVGSSGSNGSYAPSSGSLSAGDSVMVSGFVNVGGLSSGSYTEKVSINSNDPAQPIKEITINLSVQGVPDMQISSSCLAFGTLINGNSRTDSMMITNEGCDDLIISNLSLTSTEFSAAVSSDTVNPGDTAYASVTYNSTSVGTLNDTLYISTNDTTGVICLTATGQGAPSFSVNPDSIYISHSGCNDTLNVPVSVRNIGGLSPLDFNINGGSSSGGTLNVVMLRTYADIFGEYASTYNSLVNNLTNASITESNATTASGLTADLSGADVLVISEQQYISTLEAQNLAPAVQAFANAGKAVVVLFNGPAIHSAFGVTSFSGSTMSIPITLGIPDPSHPVLNGTTGGLYHQNATEALTITSPNLETIAYGYNLSDVIIGVHDYGAGKVGFYGFDFFSYDNNTEVALANLVDYVAQSSLPTWLEVQPDSGQVANNDSMSINLQVITTGMTSGTYDAIVTVNTNDPANPIAEIPVVLDLNGSAQMALNSTCVNFDSVMVGAVAADSAMIRNIGCDTLIVNGLGSSSGDFSLAGPFPLKVAPGDTLMAGVNHQPSSIGLVQDSLIVYANSDSLALCVNGKGLGAPQINTQTDTMEVTVNKCNGFKIEKLKFGNTGQGIMNYELKFGQSYLDTSSSNFYTNGASTTHSFSGLPANADTIFFTVVVNGDFDGSTENFSVYVDGTTVGTALSNNLTIGINDTIELFYAGPDLSSWLSDGALNVTITNSSPVNPGLGGGADFHFVEVRVGSGVAPSWLSILSAKTGTLPVGNNTTKNLLFDANGLSIGLYETILFVNSNDPVDPNYEIPIRFNVVEKPTVRISDTCLLYSQTMLGDTAVKDFWIYNDGCKNLNVSGIIPTNPVFKVSPANATVPMGDSVLVTVSFIPTTISNFSASILLNNNDTNLVLCLSGVSNALPVADFNFSVINNCMGQVIFSDHSSYNPTSYFWDFDDGNTSTQASPVHTFAKAGTYNVRMRVSNSAGFDTIVQAVTVSPLYVNFSMTADTVKINTLVNFYDSSAVADEWNWNFGDGGSSTSQNPTHTYTQLGNYQVTLEAEDSTGCKRTETKTIYVVDKIGIDEINSGFDLKVYPNPTEGIIYLVSDGLQWQDCRVEVFDASGKQVMSSNFNESDSEVSLNLSSFETGLYQVVIFKNGSLLGTRPVILK